MKKMQIKLFCLLTLFCAAYSSVAEVADGGLVYTSSLELRPGEWNSNFKKMKDKADREQLPLVVMWANPGCSVCKKLEGVLNAPQVYEWQKEKGYLFVFGYGTNGDGADAKKFARSSELKYPYIALYYNNGINVSKITFSGKDQSMPVKAGTLLNQFTKSCEQYFKGYKAKDTYLGGQFAIEETEGHRLEAESSTSGVIVSLTRDAGVADIVTNNLIDVVSPDGTLVRTENVTWTAGQTNQTIEVDIANVFDSEAARDGDKAFLVVKDADGTVVGTNSITYVDLPNSAANPLWIGERSAGAPAQARGTDTVPQLAWGEWTMDYEVATQRVAQAEGEAYTLVAVQGSLWCHDCANTERNFLNVLNDKGESLVDVWAKSNNVALVAVDVPNFTSASVECESPTLLSRKGYSTTLAYELPDYNFYDYSLGGADESLLAPMKRSGLGYLTRKGVSDEEALAVLERNRILVQTDTSKGGFHRPDDTNPNRTGVPIFVLLRKDGSVAARMTRFAAKSPYTDAREKCADILKRFDEMLEIADAEGTHFDDIENDYPGDGAIAFNANGGEASGEVSHCDFKDVFKLNGVGGNALQKISVEGASDADVAVEFCMIDEDGSKKYVGDGVTGKLSSGVTLEHTFTEPGDYYVEVSGADITSEAFEAESSVDANFHSFKVSGDVVLVPQEKYADAEPGEGLDYVVVRIAKDTVYKFTGVHVGNLNKAVLKPLDEDDPYCKFFTALVDGDVSVPLSGAELRYQIWKPGKVGFVTAVASTNEAVGDYFVALARTEGTSGDVTIEVVLDEENTTFYNSDGEKRFSFEPVTITWKEGVIGSTNITVTVFEDERFDGAGDIALKFIVKDGLAEAVQDTFVLTVKDNDVQSAGKAAFVGAEPFFSKKLTVYVREGESATLYAKRLQASDGPVSVGVKSSLVGVEISGDVSDGELQWGNHRYEDKSVVVSGVPAGKTVTVSFHSPKDGLQILSASNNVRVVGVAADAPAFATETAYAKLYRNVATSNSYPVAVADGAEFTKMTFKKLSGTLPSGLKVSWDSEANALLVSGVAKAKAGVYNPVYQVEQVSGSKRKAGLTLALTIEVVDPFVPVVDDETGEAVPSVFAKSRTFKDIPVFNMTESTLVGTLQLTMSSTGKTSAKLLSADGAISFSSSSWVDVQIEDGSYKSFVALLTSRTKGYLMVLQANVDGSFDVLMMNPENEPLKAQCDGNLWSKANKADAWKGYYTVALRNEGVVEGAERPEIAPKGHGYLTLKMTSSSAFNTGKVTWAGMLPNGTAVSGSSTLQKVADDECNWGRLPIFRTSSKDILAGVVKINSDALKNKEESGNCQAVFKDVADFRWSHYEKALNSYYDILFDVYGGIYDSGDSLLQAWDSNYSGLTPNIVFDRELAVTLDKNSLDSKIAISGENNYSATISISRSTGIVSGSVKVPYQDEDGNVKTYSAKYKGVVLIGWGPGCGCTDTVVDVTLPFMSGAYYYADTFKTDSGKSVKVNVGSSAEITTVE